MKFSKKLLKIFSITLAVALLASVVPAFSISAEETETVLTDLLIEDFDALNSSNISSVVTNQSGYVSLSDSVAQSGNQSLCITSAEMDTGNATEETYGAFDITFPTAGDIIKEKGYGGLKLWFNNTTGKDLTVDIRTHNGDMTLPSRAYYLTEKSGTTFACKAVTNSNFYSRGAVVLKKDFEGWVYIPYSSFQSATYEKIRISVAALQVNSGALYLDSIYAYEKLPDEIVYESFENGFYKAEIEAISTISDEYSQDGNYSWKLSTAGFEAGKDKDYVRSRVYLNNTIPDGKNIKMWVKNTSSADVKIDFRTNNGDGLKSAVYYLEDDKGSVKSLTTVYNAEYWNRYALVIPQNFEGWLYVPFSSLKSPNNAFIYLAVRYDALQSAALYIDSIQSYSAAPTVNFIENFDYGTTIPETWIYASISDEYAHSGGKSLKLTTAGESVSSEDINENYFMYIFSTSWVTTFTSPDTSKTGFRMWLKNATGAKVKMGVWTNGSNNMKNSSSYYLQDDTGAVIGGTAVTTNYYSKCGPVIPADFEGWLYLPYSSFSDTGSEIRIAIHKNAVNTGEIYIDSIQNYTENPEVNLIENFDYGTDITSSIAQISADYVVSGNNSLKISSQGMELDDSYVDNYFIAKVTPYSTNRGNGIGYKFWIMNTAGNDIKLDVRTEGGNQLKENSPYYLINTAGDIVGNKIVSNAEFYSRGIARIPAGFEGWMYIPVSSFTTDYMNVVTFSVNPLEVNNGALYVDSVMSYTENPEVLPYDANGDGKVDIRDLVRIKKYIADSNTFISFFAADSNGDSKINSVDLASLRKKSLGITNTETENVEAVLSTASGFNNTEISVAKASGELTKVYAFDFGVSTSNVDNTIVLQNAFDYCAQRDNTMLVIESGTYYFRRNKALKLNGAENVIIDGNNAEFIFSNLINEGSFISVENCTETVIQNLVIDWNWNVSRLADVIKVAAKDENSVSFEFLETDNAPDSFTGVRMDRCNPETYVAGYENGKYYYLSELSIDSATKTSNKVLQISCKELAGLSVGDTFILYRYHYGTHATAVKNCSDLTFENVTVYSAPGMAFSVNGSDHFRFINCNVNIRPDSNRHVSTTADALHIGNGGGYFIIEGCNFGYMGDDALNIHTTTNRVTGRVSDNTLDLDRFLKPAAGAVYEFRNTDFSTLNFSAKPVSVSELEDGGYRVEFNTVLPESIVSGCVLLQKDNPNDNYVVRNNSFHDNRSRGVLLGTGNGIFESNTISNTAGQAIIVSVDHRQDWAEGNGVNNLIIKNNKIDSCNVNGWGSGVVELKCDILGKISDLVAINNVTFEDNMIINSFTNAFSIASADNISIIGNTFEDTHSRLNNSENRAVVYIEKSARVTVRDNIWKASDYVVKPATVIIAETDRIALVTQENNTVQ